VKKEKGIKERKGEDRDMKRGVKKEREEERKRRMLK